MGLLLRVFVFGQRFLRALLLMGVCSRPKVGFRLQPSTCSKSKGGPNGREGRGGEGRGGEGRGGRGGEGRGGEGEGEGEG